LSFRQPYGFDGSLATTYLSGLSIHRHAGNGSASKTIWVDTLADGENYADTANGLSITQLSHTDSSVSIQVDLTPTCTPNKPTVSATPQSQTDLAGSTLNYDLTITNNDTAICPDSSWSLATQIPAGWSNGLTSSMVTIAPGSTATVKWQVSSASTSANGNYTLTVNLTDSTTITHDSSIAANYSVTTPSDTQPPTTPSGLTASLQRKLISVSWKPSTDNTAVAGYKLFRNNVQIATTTSTSYSDTNLISGTTYKYNAVAFDAAKNESSMSGASNSLTYGSTGGRK
jgi:hypothetical protein